MTSTERTHRQILIMFFNTLPCDWAGKWFSSNRLHLHNEASKDHMYRKSLGQHWYFTMIIDIISNQINLLHYPAVLVSPPCRHWVMLLSATVLPWWFYTVLQQEQSRRRNRSRAPANCYMSSNLLLSSRPYTAQNITLWIWFFQRKIRSPLQYQSWKHWHCFQGVLGFKNLFWQCEEWIQAPLL